MGWNQETKTTRNAHYKLGQNILQFDKSKLVFREGAFASPLQGLLQWKQYMNY